MRMGENSTNAEFDLYYKGLTGNKQKVCKHFDLKVTIIAYTFVISALETSGKGTGMICLYAVFHPCTDTSQSLAKGCHCHCQAHLAQVSIKCAQ